MNRRPTSSAQCDPQVAPKDDSTRANGSVDTPLVSIGIFVYNEGRFVRDSLQSLLSQDYPNIEFLISDNCSTDETSSICEEISSLDKRVRYERLDRNIGSAANSIRVLERATGDYFMWASGHDLWTPNYVSSCVAALQENPDASVAYGTSDWIDRDGRAMSKQSGHYDTRGMDPAIRLFFTFWGNLHPILGVIRIRCLRLIPKIYECAGTDQIVLAQLALAGAFLHVPTARWSRREPRDPETHKQKLRRYLSAEFGLAGTWLDRTFPLLRLPLEIMRAVWRAPFRLTKKLAILVALPPAFLLRYLVARNPEE
jgi:glycosyltransferase involved in cell wall biosynthesis